MGKRYLYLVRHGQYTSTSTPPEEPDGSLTEIGRKQAAVTALRFQGMKIDAIHTSTLQRTLETTEILAGQFPGLEINREDLLRECIPCVPKDFKEHFAGIPADYVARGAPQAKQAFEKYFQPLAGEEADRHELIVSHGNLLSYFVSRVMNAPCESWVRLEINLCGVCEVVVASPKLSKVLRHNDTRHLPVELVLQSG